ncbi:hypothetical protein DFJ58DRAFT_842178, partial [Suillus subalutaceus]|uniref:uncharacterized protein n=1 Tax=Suillus subalutaceus TaxID=48586 RepID=UPI001B85D004
VLDDHHARNRRPRIPDPDKLEHLRRHATTQDLAEPSEEEEVVVPRKRMRTVKSTAQNIRFYPPSWRDVLEAAKKKSRLGLLTSTASKHSDFLQTKAIKYILEMLDDFGSQGIGVDNGYWDEHKSDMAVLLWDDRATMCSEMKKVARPIVLAHYEILPHDIDNEDDCEREDGSFLWDGVDALGRTNNLANEALGSFCMSYFYKGENALTKTFPDLFADAVPEGAVALAATAQLKFVAELYQPIYDNVIKLYNNVKKDHYHAKKCRAARKKWARAAGIPIVVRRNDDLFGFNYCALSGCTERTLTVGSVTLSRVVQGCQVHLWFADDLTVLSQVVTATESKSVSLGVGSKPTDYIFAVYRSSEGSSTVAMHIFTVASPSRFTDRACSLILPFALLVLSSSYAHLLLRTPTFRPFIAIFCDIRTWARQFAPDCVKYRSTTHIQIYDTILIPHCLITPNFVSATTKVLTTPQIAEHLIKASRVVPLTILHHCESKNTTHCHTRSIQRSSITPDEQVLSRTQNQGHFALATSPAASLADTDAVKAATTARTK